MNIGDKSSELLEEYTENYDLLREMAYKKVELEAEFVCLKENEKTQNWLFACEWR